MIVVVITNKEVYALKKKNHLRLNWTTLSPITIINRGRKFKSVSRFARLLPELYSTRFSYW